MPFNYANPLGNAAQTLRPVQPYVNIPGDSQGNFSRMTQAAVAAGIIPQTREETAAINAAITPGRSAMKGSMKIPGFTGGREHIDNRPVEEEKDPYADIRLLLEASQKAQNDLTASFQKSLGDMQLLMKEQNKGFLDQITQMNNSFATMQAQNNPQRKENVLGIKSANSNANSPQAQQYRAGMRGSFSRDGLRIKALNI